MGTIVGARFGAMVEARFEKMLRGRGQGVRRAFVRSSIILCTEEAGEPQRATEIRYATTWGTDRTYHRIGDHVGMVVLGCSNRCMPCPVPKLQRAGIRT
ncbi:MAG TPA: hypothetical protein VH023_08645, partial [Rhodopila sp.]|nr:hypothetical protein [Rhodopila sp.]